MNDTTTMPVSGGQHVPLPRFEPGLVPEPAETSGFFIIIHLVQSMGKEFATPRSFGASTSSRDQGPHALMTDSRRTGGRRTMAITGRSSFAWRAQRSTTGSATARRCKLPAARLRHQQVAGNVSLDKARRCCGRSAEVRRKISWAT